MGDPHRRPAPDRPRRAARPAASSADPAPSADDALAALVPLHLGALGPATRAELAHVLGATLGAVDRAVAAAGDALVRLDGPDDEVLVELADPGPDGPGPDPVVLLPEFDALLVGLRPGHRTRFLDAEQLAAVWSKVNGVCAPTVLHERADRRDLAHRRQRERPGSR